MLCFFLFGCAFLCGRCDLCERCDLCGNSCSVKLGRGYDFGHLQTRHCVQIVERGKGFKHSRKEVCGGGFTVRACRTSVPDGDFVDFDIDEALAMNKGIPEYQFEVCKNLSI